MIDNLEVLLKEALKHELNSRRGRGTLNRLKAIDSCVHSLYSDPNNWISGRTLSLIHVGESGEETFLGLFHEFVHKKTSARKLSPGSTGDPDGVEYVKGEYWLHPIVPEIVPTTLTDILAIRFYLARVAFSARLMKEINGEALLRELEDLG